MCFTKLTVPIIKKALSRRAAAASPAPRPHCSSFAHRHPLTGHGHAMCNHAIASRASIPPPPPPLSAGPDRRRRPVGLHGGVGGWQRRAM